MPGEEGVTTVHFIGELYPLYRVLLDCCSLAPLIVLKFFCNYEVVGH